MPSETSIYRAIIREIEREYGARARVVKMHGNAFTGPGLPDIIGCVCGRALAIEVKRPGEKLRPAQTHEVKLWREAGAIAGEARSVLDAMSLIKEGLCSPSP